jgi:hypothetical protein
MHDGSTNGKGIEYAFKKYLDGAMAIEWCKIAKKSVEPISDVNELNLKMVMILYQTCHIRYCVHQFC